MEAEGTQIESEFTNPVEKEALDILNRKISNNGEWYKIGLHSKKPMRFEKKLFCSSQPAEKYSEATQYWYPIKRVVWSNSHNRSPTILCQANWNAAARTREILVFASSPGGGSKQARKSAQSSKCCGQVQRSIFELQFDHRTRFAEQLGRNFSEILWKLSCHSLWYLRHVHADSYKAWGPICTTLSLFQWRDG